MKKWRTDFEALKLGSNDIAALYRVFSKIDGDNSGEIDVLELLMFLDIERSDFSTQVFAVMDSDMSGHIDFYEFSIAMWNYCTLGEESLSLFAFDIYDKDCSGVIEAGEIDIMLSDLYGKAYHNNTHAVKMHNQLAAHPERKFTPDTFRTFSKHNPSLFFPAFEIQDKMQTKVIGKHFWSTHAAKRVLYTPDHRVLTVKDVIGFHTDQQSLCDLLDSDGMLCDDPYVRKVVKGKETLKMDKLLECVDESDPIRKCVGMLEVTDTRNKRAEAALHIDTTAGDPYKDGNEHANDRIQKMFHEPARLKRFEIGHHVKKRASSYSTQGSDDQSTASLTTISPAKRDKQHANVQKWIKGFQQESEKNLLKARKDYLEPVQESSYHIPSLREEFGAFLSRHIAWKARDGDDDDNETFIPGADLRRLRALVDRKPNEGGDGRSVASGETNKPKKKQRRFSSPGLRYVTRNAAEVKVVPVDSLTWDSHPANPDGGPPEGRRGRRSSV